MNEINHIGNYMENYWIFGEKYKTFFYPLIRADAMAFENAYEYENQNYIIL